MLELESNGTAIGTESELIAALNLIRWGTATLRTDSFVNEELFVSLCLLFFDNLTAILTE